MNIALDCDGVITEVPEFWAVVSKALIDAGHKGYVITDITPYFATQRLQELQEYGIHYTHLICTKNKRQACEELQISYAIDDMGRKYYPAIKEWCPCEIIKIPSP